MPLVARLTFRIVVEAGNSHYWRDDLGPKASRTPNVQSSRRKQCSSPNTSSQESCDRLDDDDLMSADTQHLDTEAHENQRNSPELL